MSIFTQHAHHFTTLELCVIQRAASKFWCLLVQYFVTQSSKYTASSECLQKHMRMPGQLQYPFTSHYFLFLPNLLRFRTKVSLEQQLSHYGPYIPTMCSSMLDDYLNRHNYSSKLMQ